MRVDAQEDSVARLSSGETMTASRPLAKIIRAYRVDELPQLYKYLEEFLTHRRPRPERPEIAAQYCEMPEFSCACRLRLN